MTPSTQEQHTQQNQQNANSSQFGQSRNNAKPEEIYSPLSSKLTTEPAFQEMQRAQGNCTQVPSAVLEAVYGVTEIAGPSLVTMRDLRTHAIAPRMAVEGWRFDSSFPEGTSPGHKLIYALILTTLANKLADDTQREIAQRQATQGTQAKGAGSGL